MLQNSKGLPTCLCLFACRVRVASVICWLIVVDKNRIARVTRTLDTASVVNMQWSVIVTDVLSKYQAAKQLRATDVQLI